MSLLTIALYGFSAFVCASGFFAAVTVSFGHIDNLDGVDKFFRAALTAIGAAVGLGAVHLFMDDLLMHEVLMFFGVLALLSGCAVMLVVILFGLGYLGKTWFGWLERCVMKHTLNHPEDNGSATE